MKFQITRSSEWGKEKPCEEATEEEYIYVDQRFTDDPANIPAYNGETNWWYSEGRNHRVENGQIKRDMETRKRWIIEINSLEELLEFQEKYSSLVLEKSYGHEDLLTLEIYDSYRE